MNLIDRLLAAPLNLNIASDAASEWFLFLGSFHSLIVHFPIVLVVLVLALEVYTWNRRSPAHRALIRFVLILAVVASFIAPVFGWMLAWADGYSGNLVQSHMWAGSLVPLLCLAALLFDSRKRRVWYTVTLVIAVALVSYTGFLGGQIAHGESHLSAHMPDSVRALTGIQQPTPPAVDTSSFFGARVVPLLSARCISCHGAEKSKGRLRLDSFEGIMHGGRGGAVVVPGDVAASDLYRRITLAEDHENFMPGGDKPPLSAADIETIGLWIEDGASLTTPESVLAEKAVVLALPRRIEVTFPKSDPQQTASDRQPLAQTVTALQEKYPHILIYESRFSADLELNAAMRGGAFGDADLAAFAAVASHIVRADLTGTSITDTSADSIMAMHKLRKLRVGQTALSDGVVAKLATLPVLQSLNISDIEISAQTHRAFTQLQSVKITGLEP